MTAFAVADPESQAVTQSRSTLDIILVITGGQVLIPLPIACKIAGISYQSWRNREATGKPLPFPATPRVLQGRRRVHVRDLVAFIDLVSGPEAVPAPVHSPPPPSSTIKRGPGRPRNADRFSR